ncbi:MAG TPA: DciA family protein [Tepidisphaeraceae bacterium]|nr:DciA family protein [Tepidisphaeraceae bacterium]
MRRRTMNTDRDNLARMQHYKQTDSTVGAALGPEMLAFFKQTVAKRQTKLAKIAEVWGMLVPEMFCEHCSLDSLVRGTLSVSVDSSAHLYELRQLLLSGLEQQILMACKGAGLRKIVLRAGTGDSARG